MLLACDGDERLGEAFVNDEQVERVAGDDIATLGREGRQHEEVVKIDLRPTKANVSIPQWVQPTEGQKKHLDESDKVVGVGNFALDEVPQLAG